MICAEDGREEAGGEDGPASERHLQILEVDAPDEREGAFAAMPHEDAAALFVFYSPFFTTHRMRVLELAAKHRLPGIYE